MDFIYLLNSRDVGATVQDVGEASSVGLRREKAIFRMESLGGTVDGHCQGKQIFSSHALTFSPEAVGLGHNFFFSFDHCYPDRLRKQSLREKYDGITRRGRRIRVCAFGFSSPSRHPPQLQS